VAENFTPMELASLVLVHVIHVSSPNNRTSAKFTSQIIFTLVPAVVVGVCDAILAFNVL
jgi:hypothetical protein